MASCTCADSDADGHFVGANCATCKSPFLGDTCKTTITNFTLSEIGDRMSSVFVYDKRLQRKTLACNLLFSGAMLTQLGTDPICQWPSTISNTFEVIFGAQASVQPNSQFDFNWDPLASTRTAISLQLFMGNVNPPVVDVRLPISSVICDNIVIDASRTTSTDRRKLTYYWSCNAPTNSILQNYVASQTDPVITVPSYIMESAVNYRIYLQVANSYGIRSNSSFVTISKSLIAVPLASINAPASVQTTQASKNFVITASIKRPSCDYMSTNDISMEWVQTQGIPLKFLQRNGTLTILNFESAPTSYSVAFSFRAFKIVDPAIGSRASVVVRVESIPLVAFIAGGAKRSQYASKSLTLDASRSFDPLNAGNITFDWQCEVVATSSPCALNQSVNLQGSILAIPANGLNAGSYMFTLHIYQSTRASLATVEVLILPDIIVPTNEPIFTPDVLITSIPVEVAKADPKFSVRSIASISELPGIARSRFDYFWSVFDENDDASKNVANIIAVSSIKDSLLIVNPNNMIEGHSYLFTVNASFTNNNGIKTYSFASGRVACSSPILPGDLRISPASGIAMSTLFSISCSQFQSVYLPLQYSFKYIDSNGNQIPLSPTSQSNMFLTMLPPGNPSANYSLTLVVTAKDAKQSTVSVFQSISVYIPHNITTNSTILTEKPQINITSLLNVMYNEQDGLFVKKDADVTFTSTVNDMAALIAKATMVLDVVNMDSTTKKPVSTSDDCPDLSGNTCPNNCSSAGICDNGKCICDFGRNGTDCRLTAEDMANKEYLRTSMLKFLWDSIMNQLKEGITDENALMQLATLSEKLTLSSDELSTDTQRLMITLINELCDATTLSEQVLKILIRTSSNIAERASSSEYMSMIAPLAEKLLIKLTSKLLPGDKPTRYADTTISSVVQRSYRDNLANLNVKVCMFQDFKSSTIQLPSIFKNLDRDHGDTTSILGTNIPSEVSLKVVAIKQTQYTNIAPNMTSDIVSVELTSVNGTVYKLKELAEPILFTLPIKDRSMFNANFSQVRWSCRYYNHNNSRWQSDGCLVHSVDKINASIACTCNHTTDYAVFLEPYTPPSGPVITPQEQIPTIAPTFVAIIYKGLTLPVSLSVAALAVIYGILLTSGIMLMAIAKARRANAFNKYAVVSGPSLFIRKVFVGCVQSNLIIGFGAHFVSSQPKLSVFSQSSLMFLGTLLMMMLNMFLQNLTYINYATAIQSCLIGLAAATVYRGLAYAYSKVTPVTGCKIHPEYDEEEPNHKKQAPFAVVVLILAFVLCIVLLIASMVCAAVAMFYYPAFGPMFVALSIALCCSSCILLTFSASNLMKKVLKWEYAYPRILGIPLFVTFVAVTLSCIVVIIYFGLGLTYEQAWNCVLDFCISLAFDQVIVTLFVFTIVIINSCFAKESPTNKVMADQSSSPVYVTRLH